MKRWKKYLGSWLKKKFFDLCVKWHEMPKVKREKQKRRTAAGFEKLACIYTSCTSSSPSSCCSSSSCYLLLFLLFVFAFVLAHVLPFMFFTLVPPLVRVLLWFGFAFVLANVLICSRSCSCSCSRSSLV